MKEVNEINVNNRSMYSEEQVYVVNNKKYVRDDAKPIATVWTAWRAEPMPLTAAYYDYQILKENLIVCADAARPKLVSYTQFGNEIFRLVTMDDDYEIANIDVAAVLAKEMTLDQLVTQEKKWKEAEARAEADAEEVER
jgi:hypothetical protein